MRLTPSLGLISEMLYDLNTSILGAGSFEGHTQITATPQQQLTAFTIIATRLGMGLGAYHVRPWVPVSTIWCSE